MRRLLILPAVAVVATLEIYRRGYMAAVMFGTRQWCRARPDRWSEPDYMA